MSEWKTSPCKGCGEPMVWTMTKKAKRLPLDATEVSRPEAGPKALLFEIQDQPSGAQPLAVLTHAESGHLAHWATCDKREQFQR